MAPLKINNKISPKSFFFFFFETKFGKRFLVISKKIVAKFLTGFKEFEQTLKKIYQNGKSGLVTPVKQGFLFSWPKGGSLAGSLLDLIKLDME